MYSMDAQRIQIACENAFISCKLSLEFVMKKHVIKNAKDFSKIIGLSDPEALEAEIKVEIMNRIRDQIKKLGLTHEEASRISGVGRTAITGIVNHSIQRITIDRLFKVLIALGITPSIQFKEVKKAA